MTQASWVARARWLLWPQLGLVVGVTILAWTGRIPNELPDWPNFDKVAHFVLFGMVAFYLELWLPGRRWRGLPLAVLLPLLAAAAEEAAQSLSPRRSCDLGDLLCDVAGMTLCWLLARALLRWEAARGLAGSAQESPTA